MIEITDEDQKWFDDYIAKLKAENPAKFLQKQRPWVYDIIRILMGRPNGLTNQQLYRELHSLRDPTELPKPIAFEAAIRSVLNGHHSRSSQWSGNELDALFFQPKGRGTWAVHREKIKPWLTSRGFSDV